MDYEKKYKEALERAKEIKEKIMYSHLSTESCKAVSEYIDTLIPELGESKDERIRRTLVEYFGPKVQLDFVRGVPIQKIRDWLEKQKEQKPVEPSDDELQRHQDELYDFKVFAAKQAKEHHISFVHDFEWNNFCAELLSYFNEQKPEWSKEDEEMRNALWNLLKIQYPQDYYMTGAGIKAGKFRDWLKSLRPSWKPSEEQMEALNALNCHGDLSYVGQQNQLISLYNDLKKLI